LKGKHADRDDKDIDNDGDVDGSDRYLHRRRQAIASRRKKDEQKEEVEEVYKYKARGAPSPKYIQGPARRYDSPLDSPKAIAAREKLRRVMRGIKKKDPDHPAVQNVKEEEVNIDELSKKTLGSYVKKASVDKSNATLDLGISQGPKQTRADVVKHAGKAIKRQKGIDKAADKLSKESKETETGDRDVGSSQYLKYTSDLTPGQGITNPQARKADVAKKIEQQRQRTAATGIDDANIPGHKPAIGMKALKQKFKASRYAVRQKQARQAIATPKKEDVDLDAIIAKKLPESAVNPMGAPSNAPSGRSVIGNTAPEKVSPVKGSVTSQASPSGSVPGESGIEKVMDKINRIVKSGHSEKIHDNVIDKDTASAIQSTYAKVNAANQEKMEKVMSKDAASMEKISKFSKKNA